MHMKGKIKIGVIIALMLISNTGCNKTANRPLPLLDGSLVGTWVTEIGGVRWEYRIGYQKRGSISGAKVHDTILIPFTGRYDTLTREITLADNRVNPLYSGKFEGLIDDSIKLIEGTWIKYSTNDTYKIILSSYNANSNRMIPTSSGSLVIRLLSYSAIYDGSLELISPDTILICQNYSHHIGETFSRGVVEEGTPIIFRLNIYDTHISYISENYDHAIVLKLGPNHWKIKWEDSENIDRDFNDLEMEVLVK